MGKIILLAALATLAAESEASVPSLGVLPVFQAVPCNLDDLPVGSECGSVRVPGLGAHGLRRPALDALVVDLAHDRLDVVRGPPLRVVLAEPRGVADPPDVVAGAVLLGVASTPAAGR